MVAALHRIRDRDAEALAVAERRRKLLFEPGRVDHHLPHPGARQRLQVPDDQRPAMDGQQRLGRAVGQRPHALAAPGREDEGLGGHAPASLGGHRPLDGVEGTNVPISALVGGIDPDRRRRTAGMDAP
jgi:hypothetical protein